MASNNVAQFRRFSQQISYQFKNISDFISTCCELALAQGHLKSIIVRYDAREKLGAQAFARVAKEWSTKKKGECAM